MVRTRPSRSPSLSTASSPRLAPESAARRTSRSPCSALNSSRRSPGDFGSAASADLAFSTLPSAHRRSIRTSLSVWCLRGCGREGPRMPAKGFDRRTPSLTAQDSAERRTNQRADTVDTDRPAACHRQIASRTSPGASTTRRRRRASESTTRERITWLCDETVAGFQRWGAAKNCSSNSPTESRDASDTKATRLMQSRRPTPAFAAQRSFTSHGR